MDWRQVTDHLRCSPMFHKAPRFDCALVQLTADKTIFVRLIFMWTCHIPAARADSFDFALVLPFTPRAGNSSRTDRELRLHRVKAEPRSNPMIIPVTSIIRGALLAPDSSRKNEFFVIDHLDGDMYIRLNFS